MVNLFQSFIVDKAGSIFRNLKLALLNVFAELPAFWYSVSGC